MRHNARRVWGGGHASFFEQAAEPVRFARVIGIAGRVRRAQAVGGTDRPWPGVNGA
jgi:hypothetical protein